MSIEYEEYFKNLNFKVEELYKVAKKARSKGFDSTLEPEPEITHDIAERIEKLIALLAIALTNLQ